MLTRLERFPSAVFRESALRELFPEEFQRTLQQAIIARIRPESGVTSLVRGSRRLTLVPDGAAYLGLDEEEPDAAPDQISHEELASWRVRMDAICAQFRVRNQLDGPSGPLHDRLYLLGEASPDRAVVLALLCHESSGIGMLRALPSLVSRAYSEYLVVCPSFQVPPVERRALESLGVKSAVMDKAEPFLLPAWPAIAPDDGRTKRTFKHSDKYSSVTIGEIPFTLTEAQAAVVKTLHRASTSGWPDVRWEEIAASLKTTPRGETTPAKMSDVFKGVSNWGDLIVSRRRRTYRLNL